MSNFGPANSNTVNLVPIQGVLDTNGNVTAVVSPNGTLVPMSVNNAAVSRNAAGQIVGLVGDNGLIVGAGFNGSPQTAPIPANVLALAQNGSAFIQAQGNRAGAPTSFTFIASPGGASVTVPATSLNVSATVAGLINGTAYTFTCTANNALGASPPSVASNSVTPTALPASILPVTRGLQFWWSSAQVAGPPANGSVVTSLVDASGNGYNAAVTSGSSGGGTWVSSWSNAKPALAMNPAGSFNYYDTSASGLFSGQRGPNETIYLVYDCTANPNANNAALDGRVISTEGPAPTVTGFDISVTGGGFAVSVGGTSGQAGGKALDASFRSSFVTLVNPDIAVPTTPIRATVMRGIDSLGNPGSYRVNGAAPAQTAPLSNVVSPAPNLSAPFSIGCMYGGGFNKHFTGRIAEIVIFAAAHTPAEIVLMETYLATRY